jgi:ribosome-associated heat shock protein Hsp15
VRIDVWLWAARFFRTRGLAQDAIDAGRVRVGGERVKNARTLRVGERVTVRVGDVERDLRVLALAERRGPATEAQRLYSETPESIDAREAERDRRRLQIEPARAIDGRPTKRDRRQLDRARDAS